MSIKDLVKWFNDALIRYNFNTQRQSIKTVFNDKIVQLPFVSKESVLDIKEKLIKNQFEPFPIN